MNQEPRKFRKYDKEFKEEAVRLALKGDRTQKAVAEGLGITLKILERWIHEQRKNKSSAFPGKGKITPEEEELHRLKRENATLKEEKEVLKKVLAIFSKGNG